MEDKDVLLATSHKKALRMPAFMRSILLHLLRDKRELQTVFVLLRFILTMLPCACAVFCSGSHLAGLLYVTLMATAFSTDTLTAMHHFMHNHRVFKHKAATWFVSVLSSVLHGIPITSYQVLHVCMHHHHSNDPRIDITSTAPFQRDSGLQFLWYSLTRWMLLPWVMLPYYAFQRRRYRLSLCSALCMASHLAVIAALLRYNQPAAVWLFIVPTLATLLAFSLHNWGQHMFLHPEKHAEQLHLSYNIINTPSGARPPCHAAVFNEGYHAIHHNSPLVHWSDCPAFFRDNIDAYRREGCFYFKNIDSVGIALASFRGRYDILSQHLTRLDGDRSEDDATFLRKRLAPIRRAV